MVLPGKKWASRAMEEQLCRQPESARTPPAAPRQEGPRSRFPPDRAGTGLSSGHMRAEPRCWSGSGQLASMRCCDRNRSRIRAQSPEAKPRWPRGPGIRTYGLSGVCPQKHVSKT